MTLAFLTGIFTCSFCYLNVAQVLVSTGLGLLSSFSSSSYDSTNDAVVSVSSSWPAVPAALLGWAFDGFRPLPLSFLTAVSGARGVGVAGTEGRTGETRRHPWA